MDTLSWRPLSLFVAGVLVIFGVAWLQIDHSEVATNWELRGVSEDGRILTIGYLTSDCASLERVERGETSSVVRLKVILRVAHVDCDDGDATTTDVELARPLGSRKLVDAKTGAEKEL
jgi:hypothetical protein